MRIENLQNENRKYAKSIGNFHVLEYVQEGRKHQSVSAGGAV